MFRIPEQVRSSASARDVAMKFDRRRPEPRRELASRREVRCIEDRGD
jgi:hypothetical protein